MMYSRAFDICQICPENTYAWAGDVTCSACPENHYSPPYSAACFIRGRVGGVVRLDADFTTFPLNDWVHEVAIMLDTETRYIEVMLTRPGSVIVYMSMRDPGNLDRQDSAMRRMSGNEKMLLFYQWWLTNDDRIKAMSTPITDFEVYAYYMAENEDGGKTTDVVHLFADSEDAQPIVPSQLVQLPDGQIVKEPGYVRPSTFYFTLSVNDSAASLSVCFSWAILFALFFFLL